MRQDSWTGQLIQATTLIRQPRTGQPGHDSRDRIDWAGQPGKVSLDRLATKVSRIMSAWKGQRGEDGQNMSARTGLGQDNQDRTTVAGQPAQDSQGRIVKSGQLGYVSLDRLA
jgi:hypothetical protein